MNGLNLSGFLPSEFGNLTHLQQLELPRNCLNGPIPRSFARLPLITLNLAGNPISGPIPKEIAEITSLEELVLMDTMLEGTLPSSLGKLKQLRVLRLAGSNFSGTVPESFGNLKKLQHFGLYGTQMSGKLPHFIGNWTQLQELLMMGTSMEGPIPTSISQLTNLRWLYISDLNGPKTMRFPNLENLTSLEAIVLINCSIHDYIPSYIGKMENLSHLFLSFNKLIGEIPNNISDLTFLEYMSLTGNSLSGNIPEWILGNKNNYLRTCLKMGLPCVGKPKYYSLFINCGGLEIEYEGNKYEDDTNAGSISFFFVHEDKWAYSSSGLRVNNGRYDNNYIATNIYSLNITGPTFYQTARFSSLSLKYHGLCMINGNYKVKLHFAEIMYSNDQTFNSLGRRIFDVSIQGRKYLSDFNIMKEAGGVGKGIVKDFNVEVNDNTFRDSFILDRERNSLGS